MYLDIVLLRDPEYTLGCKVVAKFLHDSFEIVIVAGDMYFPGFWSLLRSPVKVTFMVSVISVIALRQILTENFAKSSIGGQD